MPHFFLIVSRGVSNVLVSSLFLFLSIHYPITPLSWIQGHWHVGDFVGRGQSRHGEVHRLANGKFVRSSRSCLASAAKHTPHRLPKRALFSTSDILSPADDRLGPRNAHLRQRAAGHPHTSPLAHLLPYRTSNLRGRAGRYLGSWA